MANNCVRFKVENTPYDEIDINANWVNMNVGYDTAKFTIDEDEDGINDNSSGVFRRSSYIVNHENESFDTEHNFTIAFWAKCPAKSEIDSWYPNKLILILDTDNVIAENIPTSIDVTQWHQYSIVRDENDLITFRVDGTKFKEETNSTHLKLTSNSYVWFGNDDPVATGYDVIADDIFIFDGSIDFSTQSTDYIDTKHEKRCLYIDSETGQVYGYRKD